MAPATPLGLALACFAAATMPSPAAAARQPAQEPEPTVARLAERFRGHDVDGDGTPELGELEWITGRGAARAPRVLVMVEQRVWQRRPGVPEESTHAFRQRLERLATDLGAEGRRADVVAVACHDVPERHRDGLLLLALRRFLAACHDAGPLEGALLVGHFPDALLLRTCNWRRTDRIALVDRNGERHQVSPYLRAVPENVAHKCDLVLADLDGHWESLYFERERALPSVVASFADGTIPDRGGAVQAVRVRGERFRDAFHLRDGRAEVAEDGAHVAVDDDDRDHECTPDDLRAPNPLARPEIAVSRIDARGIARSPRGGFVGDDGRPRQVEVARGEEVPRPADVFVADRELELRLLVDYLDRNHAFRTQPVPAEADRPASAAWGLASGMASARRARSRWADFDGPGYDLTAEVDLVALTAWWRQRPALLRTLRAHSDPYAALFAATDPTRLAAALDGPAWGFARDGRALVPSLADQCRSGRADFFYYRTLWENGLCAPQPYLMVHTGCEAIAPPGAETLPYHDPEYGRLQHAEAILFYTPCVALVGRAKVFYDEPRSFCRTLAEGGTVGDAWRRTFELEAAEPWARVGGDIGRKRTYFWSLLGDFTLRLPPRAPAHEGSGSGRGPE